MTTKHGILFFILVLVFLASCKFSPDCAEIKTGKFYYRPHHEKYIYEITRTDSTHLERNLHTGKVLRKHILWLDDCSYEMYGFREPGDTVNATDIYFEVAPMYHRITEVHKDYYLFRMEADSAEVTRFFSDTIWRK